MQHLCLVLHFNPRSREGSDFPPPRSWSAKRNFNPRSREGSDAEQLGAQPKELISIHAPVKGATDTISARLVESEFQSTLP